MRLVRWLAWSVGVLFLIGAVLQLGDYFNLFTTPPDDYIIVLGMEVGDGITDLTFRELTFTTLPPVLEP